MKEMMRNLGAFGAFVGMVVSAFIPGTGIIAIACGVVAMIGCF